MDITTVAQALVFRLRRPQVGHDGFQQVEQLPDELACPFICDAVQVKVFKHIAAGSSGGGHLLGAIMPAIPPRGNLPGHRLSAPSY